MRFYTSRNLAKIVLAVFVLNICFVFTGVASDPCESEKITVASTEGTLSSAQYDLQMLEDSGYTGAVATGAIIGGISGAAGGSTIAGGGALPGAISGGIIGGAVGAYYHYDQLESARAKVRWAAEEHAKAEHNLEKCKANNSSLKYHCPYCDTYWTFETEEEYYNFSHDHQ